MNSFCWLQGAIQPEVTLSAQQSTLVHILYASINFNDVMVATGKGNIDALASRGRLENCFIGFECAGVDTNGRRIMGMSENWYGCMFTVDLVHFPHFQA